MSKRPTNLQFLFNWISDPMNAYLVLCFGIFAAGASVFAVQTLRGRTAVVIDASGYEVIGTEDYVDVIDRRAEQSE